MADLRITPGAQALVQGLAPAGVSDRADAVKAAQRAFFDAALTGTGRLPSPQPIAGAVAPSCAYPGASEL
jgi:hypothetical protein